jgi:hypothetical protein
VTERWVAVFCLDLCCNPFGVMHYSEDVRKSDVGRTVSAAPTSVFRCAPSLRALVAGALGLIKGKGSSAKCQKRTSK